MKTFAQRLQDCVDKGRLTGADLAIWFNRPYPTVRTWRLGLSEPWKPWREEAERCLIILEDLIRRKKLPMPSSFNALERRNWMLGAAYELNARLPKTRSA
jgi:hypothetical protein